MPSLNGHRALLTGKLRDETGDLLTPTHAVKKNRRHRNYVSNRLIAGGPDPSGWSLPALPSKASLLEQLPITWTDALQVRPFLSFLMQDVQLLSTAPSET